MKKDNKLKIGDLLIEKGYITKEQLIQALARQKKQRQYRPLGEILVDLRFISREQLNSVLKKYKHRVKLGELLINLKLITQDQLQAALEKQKQEGGKLGYILAKTGAITESSLINTLSIQLGIPKIIPHLHLIDRTLLKGISEKFLLKRVALPAFKEGNVLTVIMSNPLDDEVIHDFRNIFRCKIQPAIAPAQDIRNTIKGYDQALNFGVPITKEKAAKGLIIGDTNLSQGREDNIIAILDYIITNAISEEASDIHIEPKEKIIRILYRIDGILRHKTDLPISMAPKLISRIKALCGLDIAEKRVHQDGRIQASVENKEFNLRVSIYVSVYGENVVIRILSQGSTLVHIDSLGLSPANMTLFQQLLDLPAGIILTTGPTGSGKTTTLYAALNYLNNGERSIITVEDPVEYAMEGIVQGELNPLLGQTYVAFLKAMMRQDPEVIMVGEIRETASAEAVIEAALTGHQVLSTFHADDTTGALLRLMKMGIDTFLISSAVSLIIAQRLVRKLCTHCRKVYLPDQHILDFFGITLEESEKFTFYQPVGCGQCWDTGFKGRTAIHELLYINEAISNAILEHKTADQIRKIARQEANMISLYEDAFYKATKGITSLEETLRVTFYNEDMKESSRSADEIISLCEGIAIPLSIQDKSIDNPEKISAEETKTFDSIVNSDIDVIEGEVYRIRFDVTIIEGEIELIADFFHKYQEICEKMGKTIDPDLMDYFIDYIVYTVKRLETSLKARFVEFTIQVKDRKPKILLETLIEKNELLPDFQASKETGLRLINYLMPPSGRDMAESIKTDCDYSSEGEIYKKKTSSLELLGHKVTGQYEENCAESDQTHLSTSPLDEMFGVSIPTREKNFDLYEQYTEELKLTGPLKNFS